MDIASVLRSTHRDRLSLHFADSRITFPPWADWLVWLGQWMRAQVPLGGRRVAVVRLPTRRLASGFVSLGAHLSALRLHDDSLDWDALRLLPEGTFVHWREKSKVGKSVPHTGFVRSLREYAGTLCLTLEVETPKRAKGSTSFLAKPAALSYGVTLGNVTARSDDRLSEAADLLRSAVENASFSWIRTPFVDSTLVTERTSFISDLEGISIATNASLHVPFLHVLAIADNASRNHGKLQLIPSRAEAYADSESGVTILDGPVAVMRLASSRARSVVLLIDQTEYDEEVVHTLAPFLAHSVEAGIHVPEGDILAPPDGIQAFVFGLQALASDSK